jgi:uncharacterized protein YegL
MKKGLTELIFILDRSGSMSGLEQDTIGGYNSLLSKQKNEPGDANITTVLFDDKYELLHDRIDLKKIEPITDSEYFVRGTTALLDAIGRTIDKIKNTQKQLSEKARAQNVMFVITTDGMENASKEYRFDKIKVMIEEQKEKHGWEFLFIGANIDAIETAGKFGISPNHAVNYCHDARGTELKYRAIEKAVSQVRRSKSLSADWKEELENDNKKRGAIMNSVVRKKKKTLFSRIIRKIESELTPKEEKLISPYIPLDGNYDNDYDATDIQAKRDELKAAGCSNSNDDIVL